MREGVAQGPGARARVTRRKASQSSLRTHLICWREVSSGSSPPGSTRRCAGTDSATLVTLLSGPGSRSPARPTAGGATVLGATPGPRASATWRRVGYLLEPHAYPELTVAENLEVARRLQGIADRGAVERTMRVLDLTAYRDGRARVLSSGNRQRLALARALLHEPELLILDEPANGLDPAGVVEVRTLLRDLVRRRGVTVFMSSHVLAEVARLATHIAIIHRGRLVEEVAADELERRGRRLLVEARDRAGARAALVAAGFAVDEGPASGLELSDGRAVQRPDDVATLLVRAGAPPTMLRVEQDDLERHFLRLVGTDLR